MDDPRKIAEALLQLTACAGLLKTACYGVAVVKKLKEKGLLTEEDVIDLTKMTQEEINFITEITSELNVVKVSMN